MKCEECKGSGKYVGLYEVGECRACGGGESRQAEDVPRPNGMAPAPGLYDVKVNGLGPELRRVSMAGYVTCPTNPFIRFHWNEIGSRGDGQPLYDWATAVKIAEPS